MKILKSLLAHLPVEPVPVRSILVGVHWVLVCSKYAGLGSTLTDNGPHGESVVKEVGYLHQKSAQELAKFVLSDNLLEASIGMAALNSLINVEDRLITEVNAADVIASRGMGKNVAIVGHFPFIPKLSGIPKNLWVLEKDPHGEDFPENAAAEVLPQADLVAITGMTLINHTMDGLLSLCRKDATIMVLGPSTPLSPILFDYGIEILSGSRVIDEVAAALTIREGGTYQQVQGVARVTMTLNRNKESNS